MQPGLPFQPAPRLPWGRLALVVGLIVLLEIVAIRASAPASAQGLLDALFGGGWSKPKEYPTSPSYPQRSLYAPPPFGYGSGGGTWPSGNSYDNGTSGGSYRMVCVRMCDGYYYPISFGVSRANFGRDAVACQASCGSDARLFYHATSSSPDSMIDLAGRPYAGLPNAFKYRKTLVANCACKPAPWSEAELARHQQYAAAEGRSKSGAEPARSPDAIARPAAEEPLPVASAALTPSRAPSAKQEAALAQTTSTARIALPRPAPIAVERTAQAALPRSAHAANRPSGKMGIGGPVPPPAKQQPKPSGTAAVYSHEYGRFVFPNERGY